MVTRLMALQIARNALVEKRDRWMTSKNYHRRLSSETFAQALEALNELIEKEMNYDHTVE